MIVVVRSCIFWIIFFLFTILLAHYIFGVKKKRNEMKWVFGAIEQYAHTHTQRKFFKHSSFCFDHIPKCVSQRVQSELKGVLSKKKKPQWWRFNGQKEKKSFKWNFSSVLENFFSTSESQTSTPHHTTPDKVFIHYEFFFL